MSKTFIAFHLVVSDPQYHSIRNVFFFPYPVLCSVAVFPHERFPFRTNASVPDCHAREPISLPSLPPARFKQFALIGPSAGYIRVWVIPSSLEDKTIWLHFRQCAGHGSTGLPRPDRFLPAFFIIIFAGIEPGITASGIYMSLRPSCSDAQAVAAL